MLKPIFTIALGLLLISVLAACAAPAGTTQKTPSSSTLATPTAAVTATEATDKPQGELVAALQTFGNENFLPWLDPMFSSCYQLVYDMLIYWDHINHKFLPGLATSWEVSEDGLTTTYHLRKGVQFSDGWGELTSADVAYDFAMHRSPEATGKAEIHRRVASVETPDPYTVICHMKTPFPTFFVELSMANSGVSQGIVCKKYMETVGETVAAQKPIGTGPYRLVDSHLGDYYKFEAKDSHWRVVPEFKTLTVRLIPEVSTLVAALKTHEIDLSQFPPEQLAELQKVGVAIEASPIGGSILNACLGGLVIPEDKYYDAALDNKDPWVDSRVRKAMALAIDRAAICKTIYAGYADPAGVPIITASADKYQYPYDPAAAKQLLKDAGYPNGFSFKIISETNSSFSGGQRVAEVLTGYWQAIGLDPKIIVIDSSTYLNTHKLLRKTAGDVYFTSISSLADQLSKVELYFLPNVQVVAYQDEGSYAIYQAMPKNAGFEERNSVMDKLNQYFYDNISTIPLFRSAYCYAWNSDKVSPFPHVDGARPLYLEYVRHAKPLNTFWLFNPWPGRGHISLPTTSVASTATAVPTTTVASTMTVAPTATSAPTTSAAVALTMTWEQAQIQKVLPENLNKTFTVTGLCVEVRPGVWGSHLTLALGKPLGEGFDAEIFDPTQFPDPTLQSFVGKNLAVTGQIIKGTFLANKGMIQMPIKDPSQIVVLP